MNKCGKCGAYFEGKFCPECGTKYEGVHCPQCGKVVESSAKFCSNCGFNFSSNTSLLHERLTILNDKSQVEQSSPSKVSHFEFGEIFYRTFNKILTVVPIALFISFTFLSWVFMACNVAIMGISWGNVYTMVNDYDFHASAIALIVFSAMSVVVVVAYLLVISLHRNKKSLLVMNIISYTLYFCSFVTASVLYNAVKNDGLQVESAPKLFISFSIIFTALTVSSTVAKSMLAKRNSKFAQVMAAQEVKSTLVQKITHIAKQRYKPHEKMIRIFSGISIAVVLVLVLVVGVIVPIETSAFNTNMLVKINIGDSKKSVEKILGKADKVDDYQWVYYDDYRKNLIEKKQKFDEWSENIEDFDDLEDLFYISEKLEGKEEQIISKLLTISFDRYEKVFSLEMDNQYKTGLREQKEVREITLGNKKNVIDIFDLLQETVAVRTYYTDGSFSLAALPSEATAANFGDSCLSIFPDSATISWTDTNGEHSQAVVFDESNFNFTWNISNDKLYLNGSIPSAKLYNFFQIENYPWDGENVKTIWFGENVTYIPDIESLLDDPSLLENIEVDDDNPNYSSLQGILFNKYQTEILYVPNLNNSLMNSLNWGNLPDGPVYCNNILWGYKGVMPHDYTLEVTDGTVEIAQKAFENQANLVNVILPQSIYIIGDSAFAGCNNLRDINIPDNVTNIKASTFRNCSSLTSLTIPTSVKNIEGYFYGCSNLETVFWNAAMCSDLQDGVFRYCKNLTNAIIGDEVMSIPRKLFSCCNNLKNLTIGKNVTSIGTNAFDNTYNLTSVVIPNSVILIECYAFHNCSAAIVFENTAGWWLSSDSYGNEVVKVFENPNLENGSWYLTSGSGARYYWHRT